MSKASNVKRGAEVRRRSTRTTPETAALYNYAHLLEIAWGVIANAGGGDWTRETKEWQDAAARWRDDYHATVWTRHKSPNDPSSPMAADSCGGAQPKESKCTKQ